MSKRIVIIGAGIGGLATAAVLAKAGIDVTVLEAHIYAGGCAGTFYHKGCRFDAGATVAGGFYSGGPMDLVAQAAGIEVWPIHPDEPAMIVHLPDGTPVPRWSDERRWSTYESIFGSESLRFWQWQESTADRLWDLALRLPEWPPQTLTESANLVRVGLGWLRDQSPTIIPHLPTIALDALRPASVHIPPDADRLRVFVDAQLLISAQTTSQHAYALYAASALDLPRRGVAHAKGGIGTIAETLVSAIRKQGGKVQFRSEVTRLSRNVDNTYHITLKRGDPLTADVLICNLPPYNIAALFGDQPPPRLRNLLSPSQNGWGAFMLYVSLDSSIIPPDFPLHHQVICREPMGEGNTIFLSISPSWDDTRAPSGQRALTISTHTHLDQWWSLYDSNPTLYEDRKADYIERILTAAEIAIPKLRPAANLIMPGTPITFQRFTRRHLGWVGGFPQTSLFTAWSPRLAPNLWMVGDSIFPGQSVPAVAMGGLRVAKSILNGKLL